MSEDMAAVEQSQQAQQAPAAAKGITIADSAVTRLKVMYQELKAAPESGMRIAVKGGGCSGMSYVMDWAEGPKEKDRVFERDGVRVFVDGKSLLYLKGSELAYETSFMASMFKLHNPNAKSECGCGESFSV